jgi:hypothetical protein
VCRRGCRDRAPGRCAAALGIGHACDGARCIFGGHRHVAQRFGAGVLSVVEIEIDRRRAQQHVLGRQPGPAVLRRQPRHGDSALGGDGQRLRAEIRRRHAGRTLADENPDADFLAFGAADVFKFAEADRDRCRAIADIDGVGGIGAGGFCGREGGIEAIKGLGYSEHGMDLRCRGRDVIRRLRSEANLVARCVST